MGPFRVYPYAAFSAGPDINYMHTDQTNLPFGAGQPPWSAHDWSRFLTEATQNPVVVTYGRARREVIRSKGFWNDPAGRPIELRLSNIFADAPERVREAVGTWLKSGRRAKGACKLLDDWIAETLSALPPQSPPRKRKLALDVAGEHHDLGSLVAELVTESGSPSAEFRTMDFSANGLPEFTWGRRTKSMARRSLHLGSYSETSHRIHIHPVLDQANVPRWFVRYVLFHELLHAFRTANDAPKLPGQRRTPHDRKFREREAQYGDYPRASAWQKARISALIRSASSGKPLGKARRKIFGFEF
jgi:hypothetical protein